MAESYWCPRSSSKQSVFVSIIVCFLLSIFSSEAKNSLEDLPFQDRLDLELSPSGPRVGLPPSGPGVGLPFPDQVRLKRSAEKLLDEGVDVTESKDKRSPRKFLGLRVGKKAPSSFLGMRGRRADSTADLSEGEFPYGDMYYEDVAIPLDENELGQSLGALKRAPSAFLGMRGKKAPSAFLGMRGKKAPSAFLGMRGKKAPSSFLGMRGKKAPSSFLGMRGKKDFNYDDLDAALQEYYEEEKRVPRNFLGLRGKKFADYSTNQDASLSASDVADRIESAKRVPSAFLGMRG